MNWPRFLLHGMLAVVLGVVAAIGAKALFPELPQWVTAVISGAAAGLCMPVAVGRRRTSGSSEVPPTENPE